MLSQFKLVLHLQTGSDKVNSEYQQNVLYLVSFNFMYPLFIHCDFKCPVSSNKSPLFFHSDVKFSSRFLHMCSMFEFSLKVNYYFCIFFSMLICKTHLTGLYPFIAKPKHPLYTINIWVDFLNMLFYFYIWRLYLIS